MSDPRTDEQRSADDALREAITRCARAYQQMDDTSADEALPKDVLTTFVVIGAADGFELQERNATRYIYLTPDRGAPVHDTLGLLALGTRFYASYGHTADDD